MREKTENENIQKRENIITDTNVSVENINKREMIDMIIHEVKDEVSAESLKNQPFLFKGKIRLDGKLIQTIMPFEDIEAFGKCSESIEEHFDEESVTIQESHVFIETDGKTIFKVERSHYAKKSKIFDKKCCWISA